MSELGRPTDKVTGTDKQAERGDHPADGTGDRNVGGRQDGTTPVPTQPPTQLPTDDDGNDARNLGG
jgi:hypothetical protein